MQIKHLNAFLSLLYRGITFIRGGSLRVFLNGILSLCGTWSVSGVNSSSLLGKPDLVVPKESFEASQSCRYPVSLKIKVMFL